MLEINHLSFDYAEKPILHDVHFSLVVGELLHLKGANGAGKTTLLKLLAGLLMPTQGHICFEGVPTTENMLHYRESMCYLGHKGGVHSLLSAREHWMFDLAEPNMQCTLEDAIIALALEGIEDTPCGLLSAGQKHRVSLLRLLAHPAKVWLLDEPWVALDVNAISILKHLITTHIFQGGMVITTSHQPLPFEEGSFREYVL